VIEHQKKIWNKRIFFNLKLHLKGGLGIL